MRVGDFELLLVDVNDNVLSEERVIGDKNYSMALPGQEYKIKVNMYRNKLTGVFSYKYLRIGNPNFNLSAKP